MSDRRDIEELQRQIDALKKEVGAFAAWKNRAPDIPRVEDDSDESLRFRRGLAKKYMGREAEELALLQMGALRRMNIQIAWVESFFKALDVGPEELAELIQATRAHL